MQLIMDTEPSVDISDTMSTIDQPLDTSLKDPIESLKNDIANGNKENIETQKNIQESTTEAINGEELKCTDEPSVTTVPIESKTPDIEDEGQNGDLDVKTETDVKEKEICEINNGNGIHATSETKEDNDIVVNSDGEENPKAEHIQHNVSKEGNNVEEDNTHKNNVLEDDIIEIEQNLEKDIVKILDSEDISEEAIENTGLSNKDDKNTETKSDTEEDILEDVIEDNINLETDTRKDTEILAADEENITGNNITRNDVEMVESNVEELGEENSCKDIKIVPTTENKDDDGETKDTEEDSNEKVTKSIEILDTNLDETKERYESLTFTEVPEDENNDIGTQSTDKDVVVDENELENADDQPVVVKPDKISDNHPETRSADESEMEAPANITSPDVSAETNSTDVKLCQDVAESDSVPIPSNDDEDILDVDEFMNDIEETEQEPTVECKFQESDLLPKELEPKKAPICKLSNTLDILSDDEELPPPPETQKVEVAPTTPTEKQCISIEDDDDIMLIDEDTDIKESKSEPEQPTETDVKKEESVEECTIDLENKTNNTENKIGDETLPDVKKDTPVPEHTTECATEEIVTETKSEEKPVKIEEESIKPLVADNFLTGFKKNLAEMTRDELEEFCIMKIVEGIVDRSNLSDIKSKLKSMAQNIDEYKKKAMTLTKQNRDLQLVLKSVQEEQKKKSDTAITPLKITRSVGMQVLMTDKPIMRKKGVSHPLMVTNNTVNNINKNVSNRNTNQSPRAQKSTTNSQQIPVPRLVPANAAVKTPNAAQGGGNTTPKNASQAGINGMKVNTTTPKTGDKRPHGRIHGSVTVDLTDDEPPSKVTPRSSPAPPVRLVSPQNLLSRPQYTQALNSPRKVYIPISGPQSQNIRPGQTIMLKSVPPPGQRLRGPAPHSARMPQNQVRLPRTQNNRHPAPLPECMKQYQPPNWKALPPAPDLKLSKVENGIVISWKIEGYQEDSYEEIASYQLYAYQETSTPPNTALWKKIGDVKALPLPMACTLTQFMAGFKYYFAVRAVDVRSRLGPFSLPGSILLLNKM